MGCNWIASGGRSPPPDLVSEEARDLDIGGWGCRNKLARLGREDLAESLCLTKGSPFKPVTVPIGGINTHLFGGV